MTIANFEENNMRRHGYLIGVICIGVSPILFIFGFIISIYPQSMWEGTPNPIIFWLFTVLSIGLFIIGVVFAVKTFQKEAREKILAESEVTKLVESSKDSETFNYISTICPYCGSANMKSTLVEKADNQEEKKTLGFTKKYLFDCDVCKSTWFVVVK